VSNGGPSTATNIDVRDIVPNGYSYVALSIAGGDSRSDAGAPTLTWTISSLASGATSGNLTFDAVVQASGNYVNPAEVQDVDQDDPDSTPGDWAGDDYDTAVTTLNAIADLSLTKDVDDATPDVGDTVTFTIRVSNGGPSTATNIDVRDIVPNGYSYVALSITGGDSRSDAGAPTLTWTINSLASGATSGNLTFRGIVEASGNYTNPAEVTDVDQDDPDSTPGDWAGDDYDTATTTPSGPSGRPNRPSNVSPVNAACVTLPVTLQASRFSDPDPGDTHAASRWQVRTSAGNYGSPAYDSYTDTSHLTTITLTSGQLADGVAYYWHVRYQDNLGFWSNYSAETFFCTANTPTGTNVTVTSGTNGVTFTEVTTSGCTSITTTNQSPGGRLPADMCALLPYVDITTTADSDPPITVGLGYDPSKVSNENTLRLYHWENSRWVDCTTSVDTVNNIVYGEVDELSPFCIGFYCGCDGLICGIVYRLVLISEGISHLMNGNYVLTPKGEDIAGALATIILNGMTYLAQFSTLLPYNGLSN
jgi:uncharacterized repeat protein (TIGR01451 family)